MSKRHKIQTLPIVLMLFVVISMEGCSKNKDENTFNSGNEVPVIQLAVVGDIVEDADRVEEAINQIIEPELAVRLQITYTSLASYSQDFKLMMSRDGGVDLVMILQPYMNEFINEGLLLDLKPYMQDFGHGIKNVPKEEGLEYAWVGEKLYGIPVQREWNSQAYVLMREDLLEQYNLDISQIKTLADCDDVFSKIHENEPELTVLGGTSGIALTEKFCNWDLLADGMGVIDLSDNNPEVRNMYETDSFLELTRVLYDFHEKGYIKGDISVTADSEQEQMQAGVIFAYLASGSHDLSVEHSNRCGRELIAVPVGGYNDYATTTNAMFSFWGISANTQNPRLALQVLNYIYESVEVCNLFNWGIENLHYQLTNKENIITSPEGRTGGSTFHFNQSWMFPNGFEIYQWEGENFSKEAREENNRNLKKSVAFGFFYDSSSVSQSLSECQRVVEYYKSTLCYGLVNPDVILPEMNRNLEQAGLQQIMDEKQSQLDQWLLKQEDVYEQ